MHNHISLDTLLAPLFDPLFRLPFLTGCVLAVLLAITGVFLRLRKEWLSALGFSQLASCGALLAGVLEWPMLLGSFGLGTLGVLLKSLTRSSGSTAPVVMLLFGWAGSILVTANHPASEQAGHAMQDGQLYFTDSTHLYAALGLAALALLLLRRFSRWLLIERLFPDYFHARGMRDGHYRFAFDLLACAVVVLGTTSLGIMANFALCFLPPLIAFQRARHWQHSLWLASALALLAHSLAFSLALMLDQPYGPMCVMVLLALTALLGRLQKN